MKCIFSPRRALQAIRRQQEELSQARDKCERLQRENDNHSERMAEVSSAMEKKIALLEAKVRELTAENSALRLRLEEALADDEKIDKIENAIEQLRVERENDKRRIKQLKLFLADARKALRERTSPDFDDNPRPISLDDIFDTPKPQSAPQSRPEKPRQQKKPRANMEPPAKYKAPTDPDNWLQQLPDNL